MKAPISRIAGTLVAAATVAGTAAGARQLPVTRIVERVSVVDHALHPVAGLRSADFVMMYAEQPCAVDAVSNAPEPLTIAMILDTTTSTQFVSVAPNGVMSSKNERANPKFYRASFVAKLAPGDRAAVSGLTGAEGLKFTSNRDLLNNAIDRTLHPQDAEKSGPSPIWDALWHAATKLSAEPGHRAIVIATDGQSTGNKVRYADALRQVLLADASVTVINEGLDAKVSQMPTRPQSGAPPSRGAPPPVDPQTQIANIHPMAKLTQLATDTGGAVFNDRADRLKLNGKEFDFAMILEQIVRELQHTYRVECAVAADGQFQAMSIGVTQGDLTVRARRFRRSPVASSGQVVLRR